MSNTTKTRPRRPAAAEEAPKTNHAFNLDALEREGDPAPFEFILNDRAFEMSDPQEVDWQDITAAMTNPYMFFKLVLPAADQQEFFAAKLPSWKLSKLMEAYQDHYGLPSAPNAVGLLR